MKVLPIVERELRVAARSKATYWIRVITTLVAMVVGGWSMLTFGMMGVRSMMGPLLFGWLTSLALFYCFLAGIFRTADCLSRERREGTLGLLFLTDLNGFDVVIGKVVANSLHWVYGLLAIFPVLAISWLVGGVALGEFWRVMLVLFNFLFFSLAAGILVSSVSHRERRALLGTFLILMGILLVPGFFNRVFDGAFGTEYFPMVNPGHALGLAGDVVYGMSPGEFWMSLGLSHGLAWVLLITASLVLMRYWRMTDVPVQSSRGLGGAKKQRSGLSRAALAFKNKALGLNPYYWVAGRKRSTMLWSGGVMVALALYFVTQALDRPVSWSNSFGFATTMLMLQGVLKIWFAFEASRSFVDDRQSGALELVLSTPLTVREILRGQWMALRKHFGLAIMMVLGFDLLFFAIHLYASSSGNVVDSHYYYMIFGAMLAVFVLDLVALGWLGMWFGLTSRHATTAAGKSLLSILVLPWVVFWFLVSGGMALLFFMTSTNRSGILGNVEQYLLEIYISLWFICSLLNAVAFTLWARGRLRKRFRSQVAQQYSFLQARTDVGKTAS